MQLVMPGLVPGIHDFASICKPWVAGTSPAMTVESPRYSAASSRNRLRNRASTVLAGQGVR